MKPRLRWYGIMWADPQRLLDAWRYWRISNETRLTLDESWYMRADCRCDLVPRGEPV